MMRKAFIGLAAAAVIAAAGSSAFAHEGHSHHSHTGYYHGPVPLPLPVVGHWPPGEGAHAHEHRAHGDNHTHHARHAEHDYDYYGRITHIEGRTIHARSFLGLGPEWSFDVPENAPIEKWDGSALWEFSNLGRGQYVHVMYDVENGRKIVRAMHVSWMAEKR